MASRIDVQIPNIAIVWGICVNLNGHIYDTHLNSTAAVETPRKWIEGIISHK